VIAAIGAFAIFHSPSAETIRAALASTTLDHLSFHEAPASEPVAAILNAVQQQHPGVRRLRIVIHKFDTDEGAVDPLNHLQVTFDLRHVPADKALDHLLDTALVGHAVRDGAIHFYVHDYRGRVPPLTASEAVIERSTELYNGAYWKLWEVLH